MAEILAMRREPEAGPVIVRQEGRVLRLTLSNPPANALSMETMQAMQAALDEAAADKSVRVIVIAAAGKLFSGGHDLKQMTSHRSDADGGKAYFEETFATCTKMMLSIVKNSKPVIAEIDGLATAAGCQLVASCDLAICSDQSTFGVNGIDVGLFCTTPGVALVRGLKPKHAMEMLLTGEMIDAATAREFGLVNRVVPQEYLTQVVMKYAQVIASKAPVAVQMGKKAFYEQAELGLADAYDLASRVIVENMLNQNAIDGIGAFIDKKKPDWSKD